jgi:integrase
MVREMIAVKQKEGLSQSTIRNILAPIRGMFNQAIDDGDAYMNPAARVGKLNKRRDPAANIDALTREELQALLNAAREHFSAYYPLFLCAARTGLREGELVALKGIDVNFLNGGFIEVQRNLSRGEITTPKSGKSRRVDMSAQLKEVLQELLSKRRSDALKNEMQKPAGERREAATVVNEVMEGWLFTTPEILPKRKDSKDAKPRGGNQLDPSNLREAFNAVLTKAKLRRVRFHDIRHSYATLLIQQGESPAYIRDQLGHHSIQITVDIYGHLVPGGNRQAVDRLDDPVPATADAVEVAEA